MSQVVRSNPCVIFKQTVMGEVSNSKKHPSYEEFKDRSIIIREVKTIFHRNQGNRKDNETPP